MTAVNIPDMISIVKEYGLIPVSLDINPDTMQPKSFDLFKSLVSDKVCLFYD